MAVNLKEAFDRAVDRYLESEPSSDEGTSLPRSSALPSSPRTLRTSSPSSQNQNSRKRYKKSNKKSKSNKTEKKLKRSSRLRDDDDDDDDDDEENDAKVAEIERSPIEPKSAREKRGKKRSKRGRDEEPENEEETYDDDEDGAISETTVIKSKRKKYVDVGRALPKNKKLSAKEEKKLADETAKKSAKKSIKEQPTAVLRPSREAKETKETKEGKKKKEKEDFEEDYDSSPTRKNKSKRIEKKSQIRENSLVERIKKSAKSKRNVSRESDRLTDTEEDSPKKAPPAKTKRFHKEKNETPPTQKSNDKSEIKSTAKSTSKSTSKIKKLKSKKIDECPKNGEVKKSNAKTEIKNEIKKETPELDTASKKFSALIANEDMESLDSLKDRLVERQREEKLKLERAKQKKLVKGDVVHKKKVPSNGSTLNDIKGNIKRTKIKKIVKDEKTAVEVSGNPVKRQSDNETAESPKKKIKTCKHTKGTDKEESPAIQALNQATEQTLNVSF